MSKSTAQLREELAACIAGHDRYVAEPGGGLVGSMSRLENIKKLAGELLAVLDAQPSRQGKPYRVTYIHQRGTLEGRTFRESKGAISEAVRVMRIVISAGARVNLSIRNDDGEYQEKTASYLAVFGYADIAASGQYANTLESLEV